MLGCTFLCRAGTVGGRGASWGAGRTPAWGAPRQSLQPPTGALAQAEDPAEAPASDHAPHCPRSDASFTHTLSSSHYY